MTGGHVLLVDDDSRITRMIRRVAEQVGLAVTEINDSLKFEAAYQSIPSSMIVLDLNMPGKDGIELLDYLADCKCRSRVVFVSGADRRVLGTTEQLAINRGLEFAGILQKPIDVAQLRMLLDDHAKSHGLPSIEDLDVALGSDEITVAYQPKIDLRTGRLSGVEALARWTHAVFGSINPELFVGMAESGGRIDRLTEVVFEQAIQAVNKWHETMPELNVAVNLSPRLLSDNSLPDRLADKMKSLKFDSDRLILEVTERGAMDDINQSMAILGRLRLKGVGLSIDDFGTGSSSLVQLYRMPFGEIKIDKSFVFDMLVRREAEVIVDSIIRLGNGMGLNVVAEGVEDQATLERLTLAGCDQAQGYFISRPIAEPDFTDWLQEHMRVNPLSR